MGNFLEAIGIDLKREEMQKTPERVTAMYEYLFEGMNQSTKEIWGELFTSNNEGLVAIKDIPFYSMCEHHLVPFFGKVAIVYKPHCGQVAGFSKFTKLVDIISHRPQIQERVTEDIAKAIMEDLQAEGVLVVVEAQQLCMTMRGDGAHGTSTITSVGYGCMEEKGTEYHQAWCLLGGNKEEEIHKG